MQYEGFASIIRQYREGTIDRSEFVRLWKREQEVIWREKKS